ncbi:MAG: hypothetical protein ACREN2_01090 [Candidatus Dormibacteria bacterium]
MQTPVGFKCDEDSRGARIRLVRFKPAQPIRSNAGLVVWVAVLSILAVVRLVFGFGAGLGAGTAIGYVFFSLVVSIGLMVGIRYFMSRR